MDKTVTTKPAGQSAYENIKANARYARIKGNEVRARKLDECASVLKEEYSLQIKDEENV